MIQVRNTGSCSLQLSMNNYLSLKGALFVGICVLLMLSFLTHLDSIFIVKTDLPMAVDPVGMENNIEYRQQIPYQKGELNAFQIKFGTYERSNKGILNVSLRCDNKELQSWRIDTVKLVDNAFKKFLIDEPVLMDPSESYFIVLKDHFVGQNNNIAVYTSNDANKIEFNGNTLKGKSFSAIYEVSNPTKRDSIKKSIFLVLMLAVLVSVPFVNLKKIKVIHYVFLTVCGILCFRVFDYNLFQNLSKTEYVADWKQSQKVDTIESHTNKHYSVNLDYLHFDTFKIFIEGDVLESKNAHVKFVKNDGTSYFDRAVNQSDISGDGRSGKTSINISNPDKFSPGVYQLEIDNFGSNQLKISLQDNGDLNFALSDHTFLAAKIALFVVLILIIYCAFILIWVFSSGSLAAEQWFLITVVPFALIYMVLFTPLSQNDTGAHMYATYRWTNKLFGYSENNVWTGRKEDAEFLKHFGLDFYPALKSYSGITDYLHFWCEEPEIVDLPSREPRMNFYSFFNYLPQILGLTIGRLLNFSTIVSIYLGRLLIMLFYIGVMYRNIKKIPCGKWIIATTSLLPMSLEMCGAVSYDAMVIISSLSFISCIFRMLKEQSKWVYMETVFWLFVAGSVKGGGYALILLPLSFVLLAEKPLKWNIFKVVSLIVIGAFSVLLFDKILPAKLGFQFGSDSNYNLTAGYALHEPLRYIDMAMSSYLTYLDVLSINVGGTRLAWGGDSTIPAACVVLFMIVGGIQSIFEKDDVKLKKMYKWIFFSIIVIGLLSIPAMLLSWTNVDSHRIEGLQGRYFLPFLPLFYYLQTKFSLYTPEKNNQQIIARNGIVWMSILSCMFVYYIMTLYLTR